MRQEVFAAAAFAAVLGLLPCKMCDARTKAIIGYGWEFLSATMEDVHRNRAKFADAGIDGVMMRVFGRDGDGKWFSAHRLPEAKRMWSDADFADARKMLLEITSSKGLGESFGLVLFTPAKRIDWQDDAAWSRMANNLAVLGRTLKSGGFKGLAVDHEDYSKSRQFDVLPQDLGYPGCAELARRRGREVFGGFFRAFPDAKVAGFWMFSQPGGVWHDFLNGMLDVMPATARFIDGNEDSGYQASAEKGDFLRWAWNTIRNLECFVAPENLPKYRQVASVSFGQYVDCYVNGTNTVYYIGPRDGGTRVERLEENFADAARFSDDIVWIYGEKGTFIDWDCKKGNPRLNRKTWEQQLPGFRRALRIASGDGSFIEREVAEGTLTNLLKNGACDLPAGKKVTQAFGTWARHNDIPESELYAYDAADGCSKPGCIKLIGKTGCYTFCGKAKLRGGEAMYLRYAVKDPLGSACTSGGWVVKGKTKWYSDRRYLVPGRELGGGWREVFERFIVPEGVDGFFFSVSGRASKDHPIAFDDIGLYVKSRMH